MSLVILDTAPVINNGVVSVLWAAVNITSVGGTIEIDKSSDTNEFVALIKRAINNGNNDLAALHDAVYRSYDNIQRLWTGVS